jgi:hypothetical protein
MLREFGDRKGSFWFLSCELSVFGFLGSGGLQLLRRCSKGGGVGIEGGEA